MTSTLSDRSSPLRITSIRSRGADTARRAGQRGSISLFARPKREVPRQPQRAREGEQENRERDGEDHSRHLRDHIPRPRDPEDGERDHGGESFGKYEVDRVCAEPVVVVLPAAERECARWTALVEREPVFQNTARSAPRTPQEQRASDFRPKGPANPATRRPVSPSTHTGIS